MKVKANYRNPVEGEKLNIYGVPFAECEGCFVAEVSEEIGKVLIDGGQAEEVKKGRKNGRASEQSAD